GVVHPRARGRCTSARAHGGGVPRVGPARGRRARGHDRRGPCLVSGAGLWTPPPGSIPTLGVPSLEDVGRVHLIGIGGAGMRNLARVFRARGLTVTGSDLKDSAYLSDLAAGGVEVHVGHDPAT